MTEKSAFTFHHNFYPKPKIKLGDIIILDETKEKWQVLKQNYNDIVSQHNRDIGLTHLEEMVIKTNPNLPPVVTKTCPLPLNPQKFIKEEIENLLEARCIERSMSPYAASAIVVPRKCKSGVPLAETKRLEMHYWELNKQIPKVQTAQVKSKGSLALIKMAKIDHIWSGLKGAKYFTILDIGSGYHILIHPDLRPNTAFTCPYGKFQKKWVAFRVKLAPSVYLNLMFKLFFKYLDNFLVFWKDDLLINIRRTPETSTVSLTVNFLKVRLNT